MYNPSGRTMFMGLAQPLTEMSTRNISWGGKGGRCVGLTTLPPSCADCHEIWNPQSQSRPVMVLLYLYRARTGIFITSRDGLISALLTSVRALYYRPSRHSCFHLSIPFKFMRPKTLLRRCKHMRIARRRNSLIWS